MRVRARLIGFGAALPAGALLLAVLVAGLLFRWSLLRALDRALLAQAAVESVSLFDGPKNAPHVHLDKSPLVNDVRSFAPTVGLYKTNGVVVAHFPENAKAPDPPSEARASEVPSLVTRTSSDGREMRTLVVQVHSPPGEPYVLKVESPLAEIESTMRLYWQTTLGLVLAVGVFLFGLQWWQAGKMSRRIVDMTAYLPKLRGGDLEWRLPVDQAGDEIADLRVALSEAMERLRAARDAQERLIANAAHELKTPLGLMRTEMDLALRKQRSADEMREALASARAEVVRLSDLAARLLDLAALGKVTWQMREDDLCEILREACEACEASAEARELRIEMEGPEDARARIDRVTVRQAIDNYLSNAISHAPAGTTIEVVLRSECDDWLISVRDHGEGVATEEAERVFEPFYRGKKRASEQAGAGLGLSIVREIARRHGGKAYLGGTDGEGATFVLAIPRAEGRR